MDNRTYIPIEFSLEVELTKKLNHLERSKSESLKMAECEGALCKWTNVMRGIIPFLGVIL